MDPNEPTALKSLGALYLAQNNFDAALKNLDMAIEKTNDCLLYTSDAADE